VTCQDIVDLALHLVGLDPTERVVTLHAFERALLVVQPVARVRVAAHRRQAHG
jgi:hypothetical protein